MLHVNLPIAEIFRILRTMFSDLSQSPLSKNLQRLFLLRNIAIIAQCLTLALVYRTIDIEIPWIVA